MRVEREGLLVEIRECKLQVDEKERELISVYERMVVEERAAVT